MTLPEEHPEHPAVARVQIEAQWLVQTLCDALAAKGWDFVLVSVSRRVDLDATSVIAPGATGLHCHHERMREALGVNAATLRKMADTVESMVDTSRTEYVQQYAQDISTPGHGSWPATRRSG